MKEYLSEVSQVMAEQKTRPEGHSSSEAAERLQKHGPNKLAEGKKESIFVKFLKELADPMIIILLVAALISGILSAVQHEGYADAIIILIVVLVNAILGVCQESKAEKAIEALQAMAAATAAATSAAATAAAAAITAAAAADRFFSHGAAERSAAPIFLILFHFFIRKS